MSTSLHLFGIAQAVLTQATASPAPSPASGSSSGVDGGGDMSVEGAVLRTLISAGPVGVFFLMVLFKFKLMTVSEHEALTKSMQERLDEKDKTIEELKQIGKDGTRVYTEQVIPTLTRALDMERELLDLRREDRDRRRRDP